VAVIEYAKFVEPGDHRQFVHDRGRNDMEGAEALIVIGSPTRNLGSLIADFAAITGSSSPAIRLPLVVSRVLDYTAANQAHVSFGERKKNVKKALCFIQVTD
jgi:hypothetical protein